MIRSYTLQGCSEPQFRSESFGVYIYIVYIPSVSRSESLVFVSGKFEMQSLNTKEQLGRPFEDHSLPPKSSQIKVDQNHKSIQIGASVERDSPHLCNLCQLKRAARGELSSVVGRREPPRKGSFNLQNLSHRTFPQGAPTGSTLGARTDRTSGIRPAPICRSYLVRKEMEKVRQVTKQGKARES